MKLLALLMLLGVIAAVTALPADYARTYYYNNCGGSNYRYPTYYGGGGSYYGGGAPYYGGGGAYPYYGGGNYYG